MFVRKSRHFVEFAFILIFVSVLSLFLSKALNFVKMPHNDLDFNPNSDTSVNVLIDDEEN